MLKGIAVIGMGSLVILIVLGISQMYVRRAVLKRIREHHPEAWARYSAQQPMLRRQLALNEFVTSLANDNLGDGWLGIKASQLRKINSIYLYTFVLMFVSLASFFVFSNLR